MSNALTFTITGASTPTLTNLSPSSAVAGGPGFTLTVNGSNFVSGATVRWNGADRTPTTFVNETQLTAQIPATDIAAAGTASVTVGNPGGAASNALTFMITQAPPAPAPLTITTSSLPNARVGLPYSAPLAATGGTGSYTWSIASGLPPGLALNTQTGVISGMPISAASTTAPYRFTVQVSDGVNPRATKALTIKVQKQR